MFGSGWMDAALLSSSHARCEHLRVLLAIEPATTVFCGAKSLSLIQTQGSKQKLKHLRRGRCFNFGSGDWIRTSDLVVTLIHYFRNGVDYLIAVTINDCRRHKALPTCFRKQAVLP
jgi:hypothetical protein